MQNPENEHWTEIISPKTTWYDLRLRELWHYRYLISLFVYRDFVAVYKQTILGPLWHLIQPLMTTFVFMFVFNQIAGISTEGHPALLFHLGSLSVWGYFSKCLLNTSNTFINNTHIFGKVYFPRMVVPVAIVFSNLVSFFIQMGLFLCVYAYFFFSPESSLRPNGWIFFTPILLALMALLGLGLGIIVSSLTTKYRDLTHLVGFGVQLLMYATPIVYPLSVIPERYRIYFYFNPLTPLVEGFRLAFLGTGIFDLNALLLSCITTITVFILGLIMFNQVEKSFMDTI